MAKIVYRAKLGKENHPEYDSVNSAKTWAAVRKGETVGDTKPSIDELKAKGWTVKGIPKLEHSDALVAVDVAESVLPKKLGFLAGLARKLIGK